MQELLLLVRRIARRMSRRLPASVHIDDLISAGHEGLAQAIHSYDASRGVPFSTHVRHRIAWAMLTHLRQLDTLSPSSRRRQKTLARTEQSLTARLGRQPTETEIAEDLGISVELYRRWMAQVAEPHVVSLQVEDDSGAGYEPADPGPDPETMLLEKDKQARMWSAVGSLPARQRDVLQMYYGRGMKLAQVASALGVTTSRACQVKTLAHARLRSAMTGSSHGVRACPTAA